jgi:hypothetical protein
MRWRYLINTGTAFCVPNSILTDYFPCLFFSVQKPFSSFNRLATIRIIIDDNISDELLMRLMKAMSNV